MTARYQPDVLLQRDEIVAPPIARACEDHSFGMPPAVYRTMAALMFGFMAVMALGFSDPGLVVPMGINFIFLTAFFAIPAIFVRTSPRDGAHALDWFDFMRRGIATETGRTSAVEAVVLTLILPLLIFSWGVTFVVLAAFL